MWRRRDIPKHLWCYNAIGRVAVNVNVCPKGCGVLRAIAHTVPTVHAQRVFEYLFSLLFFLGFFSELKRETKQKARNNFYLFIYLFYVVGERNRDSGRAF